MPDLDPSPDSPRRRELLCRADQAAVAVLVGLALLTMGGYFVSQWRRAGGLIDIDRAAPLTAEFRVDVNSAEWPELSQLPEIGEALARRIVEARTSGGPFVSVDDLGRRVPGIGPKTLAKMSPYLLPVENRTPLTAKRVEVEQLRGVGYR